MGKIWYTTLVLLVTVVASAQDLKTRNIIVITLDGYRWHEVFDGADKSILFRDKYVNDETVVEKFWAESPAERREKLMPFFWNVISKEGQLYGNRRFKNKMRCTNFTLYSYAGYSEMFVGFVDKRANDNDAGVNPNYTVFEYINNQPGFKNSVAAFATWNTMSAILREGKSGIPVNSGSDKAEGRGLSDTEKILNRITDDIKNPYGHRYDKFTFQYAFEYLKRERPRVMLISFDETDQHGHGRRYDDYLESAHRVDKMIAELWTWLQADDAYKDQTTLLITTDHGRATSSCRWNRHARFFSGSSHIWLAVLGPDTPATGEMKNKARYEQSQIAKTIAVLVGVSYRQVKPVGKVIPSVFKSPELIQPETLSMEDAETGTEN